MKPYPPKRALSFLRWFCREDYIEEIEGDLTELFEKQYEADPKKARRKFFWNVMRCFRPRFIKSFKTSSATPNTAAMFRHNILISYRNFLRYKSSFFINLVGLSSGLACTLLIYLWVNDELQMDQFHEKSDRLYQVLEHRRQADRIWTAESSPAPLAEALVAEFPAVEAAITMGWNFGTTLSIADHNVRATGKYADRQFFNMFSFDLLQGNKNTALEGKTGMVITEALAQRLFGTTENVMGKMVEVNHEKQFMVTGLARNIPSGSSQQFEFLLPFESFREGKQWAQSWSNTGPMTFILLKPGADAQAFNEQIADYIKRKTEGSVTHRTQFIVPYASRYLYGKYENGVLVGGRITYVRLFSVIAVFIVLIACINFMNLSTARASRRLKEIGIKKAVGAGRRTLVYQHLGEALLLSFLGLVVAVGLVALLLPQFNIITGKQLALQFDRQLILAIVGITAATGLLAGSYPALYLSGFNPSAVLKGKFSSSLGELWARKGLVIFQFALSVIFIVSVVVVYKQVEFIQSKSLGYDKENIIYLDREGRTDNNDNLESFLSEVRNIPGVVNASSSGHDMTGHNSGTSGVEWPGKDPSDKTEFEVVTVNYGTMETLGISMVQGRMFSRNFTDTARIIFNEAAVAFMGLKDPIGKTVKLWGDNMEIVGVARNFNFESLHENVRPLFFRLDPGSTYMVMIKLAAGEQNETIKKIGVFYEKYNPGFTFDYTFLDAEYQAQYVAEQRVATLSRYFAGLAILISCLGLFGLAAFTAERRQKEIGIRKALGAGELGIVFLLSGDFTRIVLIAIAIALPTSYFLSVSWLHNFAYHITLQWWYFAIAGLIALGIAFLTVATQAMKAAASNPTESLRTD